MRPRWWAAVFILMIAACATSRTARTAVPVPLPAPNRPVGELAADLRSRVTNERAWAAWQLAGVSPLPDDVYAVLQQLLEDDPEEKVRLAAAWAIGHQRRSRPAQGYQPYDTPPRPIVQRRPRYPDDAYRKRIEGTVTVEILIGERGQVAHAEVRESIPELDAAAVESVREWSFEPAKRRGKPTPTMALAPVTFRIY